MAMNKKEQAAFEALQRELLMAKAFRFTEPVKRDVVPPSSMGLNKGWDYNSYIGGHGGPRVDVACTSAVHHAFGNNTKTDTQQPRYLYSTKLLALRALRYDVEKQVANILADIDEQIEQEKAAVMEVSNLNNNGVEDASS